MNFSVLPPEINSLRMFSGAGSGPTLAAAAAWEGFSAELGSAAESFSSVTLTLTDQGWRGPASAAMVAAAQPHAGWLSAAAPRAAGTAAQVTAPATLASRIRASVTRASPTPARPTPCRETRESAVRVSATRAIPTQRSTTPASLSRVPRVRATLFLAAVPQASATSALGFRLSSKICSKGDSPLIAPLTGSTASRRGHVPAGRNRKLPFSDRSNTFGETADFRSGLAYDAAVVVVTCGDVLRDGRGVWLLAPPGRLAGLGL